MTSRRGTAHVRPRPPSSGRPRQPVKVKAPDRRRVRAHRGLEDRRPRAPLAMRTLLALSVALLAGAALLAASGGIGPIVSTLSAGFGQAIGRLTATPVPSSLDLPPTDSPRIATPEQPYTGHDIVDLNVTIPAEAVGDETAKVRIYLALEGLQAVPVLDQAVGTTIRMVIPLQLEPGRNDISATLFRGSVESDHSPIVTWFLDREPPNISIISPEDGASIDRSEATIRGATQAGTTIVARNLTNSASITTVSARDGTFELALLLAPGRNDVELSGTDPAGNVGTTTLRLVQGSTEMRLQLRASMYEISVKRHPSSLQLVVLVMDPSGDPLAGAEAFFTLQIPGLAPISNEVTTDDGGRATFTTPLVGELELGSGVATVLVTHDDYGERTDRVRLRFVK